MSKYFVMNRIEYSKTILLLKDIIQDCEFKEKIYLVGGCVRDLQLGNPPKDIDLCIDYPEGTDKFIEFLKTKPECSGFVVYNRFKTGKFVLDIGDNKKIDIECVVPRIETYNQGPRKPDTVQQSTITEDAFRRDFCCNALYKNLLSGEVLDPTGKGIQDCKERILRTPMEPEKTYEDDPLRMLRAIRFACTKGFNLDDETYFKITDYPEYYKLSKERIRDEFTKILMSKSAIQGIRDLILRGLMGNIISKFQTYISFSQNNKHHDKTWAEHSFAVLDHVIKNNNASLELRLAALLHDVSKPTCYQIKEDGTYSYHGHEKESAKEAREILTELKYSGDVIDKVAFLVENHMCIKQLYNYDTHLYIGKPKKTRQLIRHLGENLYDEMRLIEADNLNHKPCWNMPGQVDSFLQEVERVKNLQPAVDFTVPVSGEDIMSFLEIGPGKLVRDVKQILQDYYDEDPELNKYGLFCKYISEFGPLQSDKNHTLWITKRDFSDGRYLGYIEEPSRKGGYWVCDDIALEIINSEELYDNIPETAETIQIQGCKVPKVWRRKQRQLKARTLMKDLEESAVKFYQEFPEFNSLELRLDNGPDLYAKVKWNDNTSEEWI